MPVLEGYLTTEPREYRGVQNVRQLHYKCPTANKALKNHLDVIMVTDGPSTQVGSWHVWHFEMVDGLCVVSPSIDASLSPCGYHDFYQFKMIPWSECEKYEEAARPADR